MLSPSTWSASAFASAARCSSSYCATISSSTPSRRNPKVSTTSKSFINYTTLHYNTVHSNSFHKGIFFYFNTITIYNQSQKCPLVVFTILTTIYTYRLYSWIFCDYFKMCNNIFCSFLFFLFNSIRFNQCRCNIFIYYIIIVVVWERERPDCCTLLVRSLIVRVIFLLYSSSVQGHKLSHLYTSLIINMTERDIVVTLTVNIEHIRWNMLSRCLGLLYLLQEKNCTLITAEEFCILFLFFLSGFWNFL